MEKSIWSQFKKVSYMSIIHELAQHIIRTQFDDLSTYDIENAKDRIMDVIGCMVSGAHATGCSMVVDLVRDWGGKKESTIIVHGGKVPTHNAAMVNSVMARSYDFEPAGPFVEGKGTPGHLSGTTIPTAIAVAEQLASNGQDLLTALILGDDMASRIVAASQYNLDSGWDCTGTVNVFGATAIAGKFWGLSEEQLINAFGIALNQMAGTFQNLFDGTHSFKLPQGLAARAGIMSVELAAKGFTSVRDPLLSKNGYFALYCKDYNPDAITKDLGTIHYADQTFKPYPCCRSNHAAIDCVFEIIRKHGVKYNDIDHVVVDVPPLAYQFVVGQPFQIGQVPQVNAVFSLQYTVANALIRKDVRLDHFSDEAVKDPKVLEFIKKIKLNPGMPSDQPLSARVTVAMKAGTEYHEEVMIPKGNDVLSPSSKDEKQDKFRTNMAFSRVMSEEKTEVLLERLKRFEIIPDIKEITQLLVIGGSI